MKVFCLLVLLAGSSIASAQESRLDTLIRALKNHPDQDTVRLNLLNDLSFAYYAVDPQEGIEQSGQAIALARQLNSLPHLATAYRNKGTNHWAIGEDSLAMKAFEAALEILNKTGNRLDQAKTLNNLALNYYNLSDFRKALESHESALSIFTELQHNRGIVNSYSNMGVVYLSLSDYPAALENFLNGARSVQAGDSLMLANLLLNIGLVHKNMKAYDEALVYTGRALGIFSRHGMRQLEANALGNLGTLYSEMGRQEEAIQLYVKALEINKAIGNKRRIASDMINTGVVYHKMHDYLVAERYLKEGLDLYKQTNDKENTAFALVKLSEMYLEAPEHVWNNDPTRSGSGRKLIDRLHQALKLAEESGSLQSQQMVWATLSEAYHRYGDPKRALDAYKSQIAFRDSIYNADTERKMARQQIQFEFEKKESLLKAGHEKNLALAKAESERRQAIYIAILSGVILSFAALAITYSFHLKRKDAEKKSSEAELQALIAETKMKALRAQMNPHFIFNSLNAVSNLIATNNAGPAEHYLSQFSRIIRLILEHSEHKEITLADDLEVLGLYLQIESMRLEKRFSYEITVDESIDAGNTVVPPLILQPLVENSIWHGVSRLKSGGKISIHISRRDETLVCVVEDNGPGRNHQISETPVALKSGKQSMGIKITRSRINLLIGNERSGAGIVFTDKPEGLRVTVSLPLLQRF